MGRQRPGTERDLPMDMLQVRGRLGLSLLLLNPGLMWEPMASAL